MGWNEKSGSGKRTCRAIGLGLSLALLGCAVGPDYRPPTTTLPAQWPAEGLGAAAAPTTQSSVATSQPADLADWWTAFKDPELNSLVKRAIASNLDLKQAESRLMQARAQRGVVAAGLWPTLNAVGSAQRSGSRAGTSNFFQAGFDAAWELDFFGGTRRNVESAEANITAAVEDKRDVLVTLLGEVATDYISLRGYQRQLIVTEENLVAQEHNADVTRKQFKGGFISKLNVANAEAQAQTTRSQIPTLRTGAQQEIYALGVLLGQDPAALDKELAASGAIPPTPPVIPIGLPSELLRRRPDIRQAEALLHAATANIGVATATLFPQFTLTGTAGLEGNKPQALSGWANRYWSLGPSVNWPIFNAGQIVSNIQVTDELQKQALLTYDASVLTALNDVYSALVAYNNEQERRTDLEAAVASNKEAVDLANRLYQQGQTDFLNVLVAQQSLYGAENSLAQSQTSVSTDLVALYKALGGGWTEDSDPPAVNPDFPDGTGLDVQ